MVTKLGNGKLEGKVVKDSKRRQVKLRMNTENTLCDHAFWNKDEVLSQFHNSKEEEKHYKVMKIERKEIDWYIIYYYYTFIL